MHLVSPPPGTRGLESALLPHGFTVQIRWLSLNTHGVNTGLGVSDCSQPDSDGYSRNLTDLASICRSLQDVL